MNFHKKYYYTNFSKNNVPLNSNQREKLDGILKEENFEYFLFNDEHDYLILLDETLIGFFSLNVNEDAIEISCLYIFEECRNKDIATTVVTDIIFAARYNFEKKYKYVVANTFVDSVMFYLKKGFNFCKINNKLNYKNKKIILMYKEI